MQGMCCPRCGDPLRACRLEGQPIDSCASCGGLVLPRAGLAELLQRTDSADSDGPPPRVPDKGAGLHCPLCAGAMSNYGYLAASFVHIDRCASCDVVFIDGGELDAMAVHHRRTHQRVESLKDHALSELHRTRRSFGFSSLM